MSVVLRRNKTEREQEGKASFTSPLPSVRRRTTVFAGQKKPSRNPKRRSEIRWAFLMIAPTVIGLAVLDLWPIIKTFLLSFQKDKGFGNYSFVGLVNYRRMLGDTAVWHALLNTAVYTILVVGIGVCLSLLLAVLLDQPLKGIGIFRTLYFLPMMAAPAAVALAWSWIFNADYGILNSFLGAFGIEPVAWFQNKLTIIPSLAVVTIWSEIGYNAVIILAGLQSIDRQYYEAALLDGAGAVTRFFKITLPMISPTLYFVITTRVIFTLKQFDFSYMMINNYNPIREYGQTIMHYYYTTAFVKDIKGYASAIVMLAFILVMIITGIQNKLENKWVNYDL